MSIRGSNSQQGQATSPVPLKRQVMFWITVALVGANVGFLALTKMWADSRGYLGLMTALMLLFNHLAFFSPRVGRWRNVMVAVAACWMLIVFAYMIFTFSTGSSRF